MAGRFRLGRRGGRVAVILATTAYVTGLAIAAASSQSVSQNSSRRPSSAAISRRPDSRDAAASA